MRGEFLLDDDNDDNDLIMAGHVKKSVTRDGTAGTVVTVKKAAFKNSQ